MSSFYLRLKGFLISKRHCVLLADAHRYANFVDFQEKTLVYRRYASLTFAMVIDSIDNPLQALISIHLLVETLDRYFRNVCELDLVFNFWKAISRLNRIVCA